MKRANLFAILIGLFASCLIVFTPATAFAETIPPLQYPAPALTSPYNPKMATAPDGSVTVGCDSSVSGRDLVTYSKSGALLRKFDRTQLIDGYRNCITKPIVDKKNILYGMPEGSPHLYAFAHNTVKWKYALGCGTYPHQIIAAGPNGVIYGLTTIDNQVHLIGLDPNLKVGQTQPTKVLDVVVQEGCATSLMPYKDGILLRNEGSSSSNYYSYGGKLLHTVTYAQLSIYAPINHMGQLVSYHANGDQRYVSMNDPILGHTVWSYRLVDTTDIKGVYPTASGGIIAHVSEPVSVGVPTSKLQKLIAISSGGRKKWEYILRDPNNTPSTQNDVYVLPDGYGRVALVRQVSVLTTDGKRRLAISATVFDTETGGILYNQSLVGNVSNASLTTGYILRGPPSIANGVLSFVATCDNICPSEKHKLYPLAVGNISMDYPRATVMNTTNLSTPTTFKQYVGVGDSFSSGQGARYYDASTVVPGTNTCYRASGAYARILGRTGSSPLRLTDFVACGGAKAREITNKWPSPYNQAENPQINAISAQTDVVTLTIGGNDIGFGDFVKGCIAQQCDEAYATSSALVDSALPKALDEAYTAILTKSTRARLYVIGYPPMLTTQSGSCTRAVPFDTAHNRDLAVSLLNRLNGKIQEKVVDVFAKTPRIQYVDPTEANSPFAGHDLCSDVSYYNGVTPNDTNDSFHPNQLGQLAYAMLITKHLMP